MVNDGKKLSDLVYARLEEGQKKEEIEGFLCTLGHDPQFVKDLVAEVVKLKINKARTIGLALIFSGALCCLLSFLLMITGVIDKDAVSFILFEMTSVGIVLIFGGLTKVF